MEKGRGRSKEGKREINYVLFWTLKSKDVMVLIGYMIKNDKTILSQIQFKSYF